MTLLLRLLQHAAEGEGARPATPFDINVALMAWTLGIFLVLLALLWKLAWPTLVRTVEQREQRIAKQLAEAEAANQAAQKLLEEHRAALAQARAEAQEMITRAKTVAQKERDALIAKTHEEQEQMLERARREIAEERDKAVAALRREAVDLAIAAAQRLVEANLDSDANRRIVTDYLGSLDRKS